MIENQKIIIQTKIVAGRKFSAALGQGPQMPKSRKQIQLKRNDFRFAQNDYKIKSYIFKYIVQNYFKDLIFSSLKNKSFALGTPKAILEYKLCMLL